MSDYFIFGTVDTRDFGIEVYRQNRDTVIPMAYTAQSPAGVSGDILISENRYPNRRITYDVLATSNAATTMERLQNALLTQIGYQRLTDSFDTDVYMMAALTDSYAVDFTKDRVQGKAKITFNRMPQRYFASNETITIGNTLATRTVWINAPDYSTKTMKPLIKIFANPDPDLGTYLSLYVETYDSPSAASYIDRYEISISVQLYGSSAPDISQTGLCIDCETMEVYGGDPVVNLKEYVTLYLNHTAGVQERGWNDLHFPVFVAANKVYHYYGSDTIDHIEVTPRWWKL